MKIAIPVDDKSEKMRVYNAFGRAPFFFIYDLDSQEKKFLVNSAQNEQNGAGVKAAQLIADEGVRALITTRCGEHAADTLEAAQIKMYKNINDSIWDNIIALQMNKLPILKEIHSSCHDHK